MGLFAEDTCVSFLPRATRVYVRDQRMPPTSRSLFIPLCHTRAFSLPLFVLSFSLIRSFFLLAHLYSCIRRLRDRVLRLVLTLPSFLTTTVRNVYQRMRQSRCINNVLFETLCARYDSAVGHRAILQV